VSARPGESGEAVPLPFPFPTAADGEEGSPPLFPVPNGEVGAIPSRPAECGEREFPPIPVEATGEEPPAPNPPLESVGEASPPLLAEPCGEEKFTPLAGRAGKDGPVPESTPAIEGAVPGCPLPGVLPGAPGVAGSVDVPLLAAPGGLGATAPWSALPPSPAPCRAEFVPEFTPGDGPPPPGKPPVGP
jgi:hypothetical protein